MYQNFDLGPSFHFMSKNFSLIFAYHFSRFPKIKTKALIKKI